MRIDVLGTPTVVGDSGSLAGAALGGRRALTVLVALALEPAAVSGERLAAMIWGDNAPPTWPVAVRGVVRSLRQAMDAVGGGEQRVIVTEPRGYRLAPSVLVDLVLAEQAIGRALELKRMGRHRAALELAVPAAELTGDAVLRGDDSPWLRPHRTRVDSLARQALDIITEAAGSTGEHLVAIVAARRRVAADPLDESAHRSLIGALHRGGDRAGAVLAYEQCRSVLAEQLGVDPSADTVQAYLATLRDQVPSSPARVPATSGSFVGREREESWLRSAVTCPGLATVTGPGGVGKSRLAARVAASAGGCRWIALGSVTEDSLVAATIAMSLGVSLGADDAAETVAAHLATLGPTMLVLDGAEVARDGVASLVAVLVAQCPLLSVVVTSRSPLGLDGELVQFLAPLPMPPSGSLELLASNPLVRLLTDRVREGGSELDLQSAAAPDVLALLRRCGGLPLAVELVAAQLAAIPAGDLIDQLGTVSADEDPLRAISMDSYALLTGDEATAFRRFAALDGYVSLTLVRQVVADEVIAPVRVVRILRELTASGLVRVDRSGPRWRYHQDDDLRRLATELLAQHGDERATFGRLVDAVRAVLPADARDPPAAYQDSVTEMLASVRSLFSAALGGRADCGACLELAFRLHRYWAATNVAEGRFWLARLLAVSANSPWVPYATYALGYLDYWTGDTDNAVAELQSAVSLLEVTTDPYLARALIYLAGLLDDLDRGVDAVAYVSRAIEAAAPFGVDLRVAAAMGLGSVLSERGDPEAAGAAALAIDLCRSAGSEEQLAVALPTAAMVCWQVGATELARSFVEEARPLHASSRRIARVVLLSVEAGLALEGGDIQAAVDFGLTADLEGTELGVEREMPLIRAVLARALLTSGDLVAAADRAGAGIEGALRMSFDFPLAVGLETAVLILRAADVDSEPPLVRLLAAAATIRLTGDRPPPATLARQIDSRRSGGSVGAIGGDARSAGRLALELLARVGRP